MSVQISFSKSPTAKADTAVIFIHESKKLGNSAKDLDKKSGGLIVHALKNSSKFTGKAGQTLCLALPKKAGFAQVICLGLGKPDKLKLLEAEMAGGKLFVALERTGARKAVLLADKLKTPDLAAHIAAGIKLRSYKFHQYKSQKDKSKHLSHINVAGETHTSSKKHFTVLDRVTNGVFTARDLVNEPPNHLHPDQFAKFIRKELKPLGIDVEIFDEKKLKTLGMGAILAVGMGSHRPPRMAIMRWKGTTKKTEPVALIGKGVTFDTGGISIKPSASMDEMKMDMGGAAAVVGTMKSLALRKSKSHIIGIVGLAENMPSSRAYRPGDILTSYSGKTIEVLNTDAEGRLILADCLSYAQKKYKPQMIIDLATLTGAMMVALGHEYCGTFVNNDKLWGQLEKASTETGDKLWRMPLDENWKKEMQSAVADIQNLGKGRYAGAGTAAGFLEYFIEGKTPWAHMDIAGTAWIKSDKPTTPKFGTGFGVRVLDRLIANHYE